MKKLFLLPIIFSFLLFIIGKTYPIYAAAPVGNYLILNGGYVKTINSDLSQPSAFIFDALINPNNVSGIQHILSIGNQNSQKLSYEVDINGGTLSFHYRYNGNSEVLMSAGNIDPNSWNQISVSVSSLGASLIVNGEIVMSGPGVVGLAPIGETIALGGSYLESVGNPNGFKGYIDEVSISRSEFSLATIPPPLPSVLLWHLDENRGQTQAYDSSGHNLNGTLVGGDSLIHFFGVLPSPTPMPTISFGLSPISWTRPVLPTLSIPNRINPNPTPTSVSNPPISGPTPTTSDRLSISNRFNQSRLPIPPSQKFCFELPGHFCAD